MERYRAAVFELKKLDDGSGKYWFFFWDCIASAETARAWKRAFADGVVDPDEEIRRKDSKYLVSTKATANAARRLACNFEQFPQQNVMAVASALLRLKDNGEIPPLRARSGDFNDPEETDSDYTREIQPAAIARLLRYFADIVEQEPIAKRGNFQHRYRFGAVGYDKPIDSKSRGPDKFVTSLLFEAVYFSRIFTSAKKIRPGAGESMPDTGDPHWALAVALVSGALGEDLEEKAAQDRMLLLMRGENKLTWWGWRDPPCKYIDTPNFEDWF